MTNKKYFRPIYVRPYTTTPSIKFSITLPNSAGRDLLFGIVEAVSSLLINDPGNKAAAVLTFTITTAIGNFGICPKIITLPHRRYQKFNGAFGAGLGGEGQ